MLTKDLLQYRNRSGRVYPSLIKVNDPSLAAVAAILIEAYEAAPGSTLAELAEEVEALSGADHFLRPALCKLLSDRCDEADDDGQIAARRDAVLKAAEEVRRIGDYPDLESYQAAVAAAAKGKLVELQEGLYADLPDCRVIKTFETLTPLALLHRYNCAQVQGLLLQAQEVRIRFSGASLAEKRRFFRCLKFQRLLGEVSLEEEQQETQVFLSGPLRIFQNAQSYGLRLAQFFPYVLQLPRWNLEAELKLNGKMFSLSLDQSIGISSHYKALLPFVPPELTAFVAAFNERDGAFKAAVGEDYLAIGRQSYCFPDVTFTEPGGAPVHLELFHRWHAGQLSGRLQALAAAPPLALIIGVAEEVAKAPEMAKVLERSTWFSTHGFVFKNLPTPKTVQQVLLRHTAAVPAKAKEKRAAAVAPG